MEYEIDDCDALFDPSTNPSLLLGYRVTRRTTRIQHSRAAPRRRRGLAIPEEEGQQA